MTNVFCVHLVGSKRDQISDGAAIGGNKKLRQNYFIFGMIFLQEMAWSTIKIIFTIANKSYYNKIFLIYF